MVGWSNHPYPNNRYPASLWRSSSACDGPFSQPMAAKHPWASFAPFSWIAREDGRRWDVLSRTSTANWKRLEIYPKVVTAISSSWAADVVGHSCLSSSPSASRAIGAKKQAPPESGSAASCPLRGLRWPQRDPDRQTDAKQGWRGQTPRPPPQVLFLRPEVQSLLQLQAPRPCTCRQPTR